MAPADIRWIELDDADANSVRHIDIGHLTDDHSTPDVLCLLTFDAIPSLCVRLRRNSNESYTFRDAQFWHGSLVIGWGHAFYIIDPDTLVAQRHDLETYFGYMHADDVLLIASGERVVRVNTDGTIAWISDRIGIDGVTISSADSEHVVGDGEWDPPGGWKPYCLRTSDGNLVSGGDPDW